LAACGAGPDPIAGPNTTPSATTIPPSTTAPVPTSGEGVAVTITASAVAQPDGSVELCPPGTTGACPGIILDGEIDPAMISTEGNPVVIQVTGLYDGSTLAPSTAPEAIEYPLLVEPEFDSRCPGLRGTPSVNPDERLQTAIGGYVEQQSDFVEMWWDRGTAVLTVWFKGEDVSAHQEAIDALAAGEPVCVAGGARFSQAELNEASNLIQGFRDSSGQPLATPGYSVGGLDNRINLFVEQIDAPTRDALTELVGDRVVIYPFIELLEDDLSTLPEPATVVAGDVDILTNSVRNAGGMAALGYFTVNYDPELNCIYFTEPGSTARIVPVWPFGYSATSDPVTVHDFDGAPIATEGDQMELGGGNVGVGPLEGNTCGANSAWIVSLF
jgi:hypothetical protein